MKTWISVLTGIVIGLASILFLPARHYYKERKAWNSIYTITGGHYNTSQRVKEVLAHVAVQGIVDEWATKNVEYEWEDAVKDLNKYFQFHSETAYKTAFATYTRVISGIDTIYIGFGSPIDPIEHYPPITQYAMHIYWHFDSLSIIYKKQLDSLLKIKP